MREPARRAIGPAGVELAGWSSDSVSVDRGTAESTTSLEGTSQPPGGGSAEAGVEGCDDELGSVAQVEFGEHGSDVRLDGGFR